MTMSGAASAVASTHRSGTDAATTVVGTGTSIKSELLSLLPSVGHTFGAGGAALRYLVWLIQWCTMAGDWTPGARAVIYASVGDIAARYPGRVSVRQINTYERKLAAAFDLPDARSGNGRRYAHRDPTTGRIAHGFGFELTNVARALPIMRQTKSELDIAEAERRHRKRTLTAERARARRLLVAVQSLPQIPKADRDHASEITAPITERVTDHQLADARELEALIVRTQRVARELEALLLAGKTCGSDVKTSDAPEESFRHLQKDFYSQTPLTGRCSPDGDKAERMPGEPSPSRRERAARSDLHALETEYHGPALMPPETTGAHRITPAAALAAASPRFRAHLPFGCRHPSVDDVEEAARSLRAEAGVAAWAWRQACEVMGVYPAALCLLISDRRTGQGEVLSTGGYFTAMMRRAERGTLHIHRSIYGLSPSVAPEQNHETITFNQASARQSAR